MKLQLTPKPRAYIGLAAYTNFLNNDPFHYERTKWNGLLIKKGMKCRPFRLQQLGDCLCAVHSDENELLATRMTLDHEPLPHLGPDDGLVAMLRRNNVLTYWRGAIDAEDVTEEVADRLCAIVLFVAPSFQAEEVASALGMLRCSALPEGSRTVMDWDLAVEAVR